MTSRLPTATTIRKLHEENQDFEWYPTTETMLKKIRKHITQVHGHRHDEEERSVNVLDCGAGDGRALTALAGENGKKYAIEKAQVLIQQQPTDVVPVGTDFHTATLIDKETQVVFSNPPYSEYEAWVTKIIREANATDIYLVIPKRWKKSEAIKDALATREAESTVIHSDDFLTADRQARAKIDIVYINLAVNSRNRYHYNYSADTDPFKLWFEKEFPQPETAQQDGGELTIKITDEMVNGKNLIEALVALYNRDMATLQKNYKAVSSLDPALLKEMDVKYIALIEGIQQRIKGLKHKYWHEFFNNYDSITDRLTTASRKHMLDVLHGNTAVEFTEENAYAITIWVIKNANQYYDKQLVTLVKTMTKKANIVLYKSNQRTFKDEEWRYARGYYDNRETTPEGLDRYKLNDKPEYRIVLQHMGGLSTSSYSWDNSRYNGLDERAHEFLSDIQAVARTLGWTTFGNTTQLNPWTARHWESNKQQAFEARKGYEEKSYPLMQVRAFKNGNIHIKFSQGFIKQLNVEFGRLMGWIKDKSQAAEELRITPEEAAQYFKSNLQLTGKTAVPLLQDRTPDIALINDEEEEETPKQENPAVEPLPEKADQLTLLSDAA